MAQNSTKTPQSFIPAHFCQLHAKLPAETYRETQDGNPKSQSDTWLDDHAGGFLFMHALNELDKDLENPIGKSLLVKSLDMGELFVNKRRRRVLRGWMAAPEKIWRTGNDNVKVRTFSSKVPGELRFSRLVDDRVGQQLPNEPYFPELYAYGFPRGAKSLDEHGDRDTFSLYFRHYNGGTLDNLMMYADPGIGGHVPEPFIWHVIKQLSRAVIYLHTGYARKDLEDGTATNQWASPTAAGWTPIIHRSILGKNVLLHFEDHDDPLQRCFPQIVLEGFDQANFENDWEEWSTHVPANLGTTRVPPGRLEDMHLLGELFRRLMTVHECVKESPQAGLAFDVETEGNLSQYLPENLVLKDGQIRAYSRDLAELLQKWEIASLRDRDRSNMVHFSDDNVRKEIPQTSFLIDKVLPLASRKVEEYRVLGYDRLASDVKDGHVADVSWVMPDPNFETVPYSVSCHTQEQARDTLAEKLKWIFGPFIPIRYRYDGFDVCDIPAQAMVFYDRKHGWKSPGIPTRQEIPEEQLSSEEQWDEHDRREDEKQEESGKTVDPHVVASIRKHQSNEKAKQKPIDYRVLEVKPKKPCSCSNCVREVNKRRFADIDRYNNVLKELRKEVVDKIVQNNPRQLQQHLISPDFQPIRHAELMMRPNNPFDINSGEDWKPDMFYPWRKWVDGEQHPDSPDEPNNNPNNNPADCGQNVKGKGQEEKDSEGLNNNGQEDGLDLDSDGNEGGKSRKGKGRRAGGKEDKPSARCFNPSPSRLPNNARCKPSNKYSDTSQIRHCNRHCSLKTARSSSKKEVKYKHDDLDLPPEKASDAPHVFGASK
ncbi:hypothetical protein VTI74DRAFT_11593 [Chaetomium olivicolor]